MYITRKERHMAVSWLPLQKYTSYRDTRGKGDDGMSAHAAHIYAQKEKDQAVF